MLECKLMSSFWKIFFFLSDDDIHLLFHVDHPKVVPLQLPTVSPVSVLLLEASVLSSKPHMFSLHLCMCRAHITKPHGQVAKLGETRNTHIIFVRKPIRKLPLE